MLICQWHLDIVYGKQGEAVRIMRAWGAEKFASSEFRRAGAPACRPAWSVPQPLTSWTSTPSSRWAISRRHSPAWPVPSSGAIQTHWHPSLSRAPSTGSSTGSWSSPGTVVAEKSST